jgi:hypothetical protein
MTKTELKGAINMERNVNKIKELLKSEDFDVNNTGLELAKSLDEPAVFEKLLEGCGVDEEGKLINENKEFSDYLICALSSYADVPTAKRIREKLKNLDLSYNHSITSVDCLSKLTNLVELNLSFCSSLNNVDALSYLSNLEYLNLIGCCSVPIEECHSSKDFIEKVNHSYNKTYAAWRDNFERYDALPEREGSVSVEIELCRGGYKVVEFGSVTWNDKHYTFQATTLTDQQCNYEGTLEELLDLLEKKEINELEGFDICSWSEREDYSSGIEIIDLEIDSVCRLDEKGNEIALSNDERNELEENVDLYYDADDINVNDTFIITGGVEYIKVYVFNKVFQLS